MKKTVRLISLLLFCILLCGCNQNPLDSSQTDSNPDTYDPNGVDYQLVEKDGRYYVAFEKPERYYPNCGSVPLGVDMNSMEELQALYGRIEEKQLTYQDKQNIVKTLPEEYGYEIVGFDQLYVPQESQDVSFQLKPWWDGDWYAFRGHSDNPEQSAALELFWLKVITENLYDFETTRFETNQKYEKVGQETFDGITFFHYKYDTYHYVQYSIQQTDKTATVIQSTRTWDDASSITENIWQSEMQSIRVYISESDTLYYAMECDYVSALRSAFMTDEWLLSFGLTEYTE